MLKICFLFSIVLILNCDNSPTKSKFTPSFERSINLQLGQSIKNVWGNYSIGFDSVYSDYRVDTLDEWVDRGANIRIWMYKRGDDTTFHDVYITNFINSNQHYAQTKKTDDFLATIVMLEPRELPKDNETYHLTINVVGYKATGDNRSSIELTSLTKEDIFKSYYAIDDANISGDTLNMRVRHPGGCATHYYITYMSPLVFKESEPVQADLYVSHYNNSDFCNALLYPWVRIDLSAINELYKAQYADTGTILLNIYENYRGVKISDSLLYTF